MAITYSGYLGSGSKTETAIIERKPSPVRYGYLGSSGTPETTIIERIPSLVKYGYLGAGGKSETISIENISNYITVKAYDPVSGEPAKRVPIKVVWTLQDGTTKEEYYYTDFRGVAIIQTRTDATQVTLQYGNASETITDPSKGGYAELVPTAYAVRIIVIDSITKLPLGGIKIKTPYGVYKTDAYGSVNIALAGAGEFEVEVEGFPRYGKTRKTISLTTEFKTEVIEVDSIIEVWRSVM